MALQDVNGEMRHVPHENPETVPAAAAWLGGLGAVPFVSLAVAGLFLDAPQLIHLKGALVAYGAVILSFLGGIHWGTAIARYGPGGTSYRRLIISVLPSLVAWPAILLTSADGLILLALAFAVMLAVDLYGCLKSELPIWYPLLRWPLTITVVVSLVLGALA